MTSEFDVADFEKMAKVAEREAEQAEVGSSAKAQWAHIANSWRLIAKRMMAERTEDEFSDDDEDESADPMNYQLSFYTLH